MEELANEKLKHKESRPIFINMENSLGRDLQTKYINCGMEQILESAKEILLENIGKEWLILTNKSLIRRTWPLSEEASLELRHNASNLTWHQDSNPKHQELPMVVLMVTLQDDCGGVRPGLSIINKEFKEFKGIYGYQGNKVKKFEENIKDEDGNIKRSTPLMNSGDLLIFNGLTFHRTYSTSKMKKKRDAFLIRVIKPEHESNFPKENNVIISCNN